uniref:Granulins domain-containing protein n=1 Tax=Ciona savignyi TaxID=51511 RepID=H2YBJ1_CIOSA
MPCDPTHSCPTGNTCCPDLSGHWACCPQGHMCMFGKCVSMSDSTSIPSNTENTDALVKVPASLVPSSASSDSQEITSVRCNRTHYCPTGNTCCRHRYGQWACCPM